MFHLQKSFESSLRGGYDLSPNHLKNKLNLQHKSCKGTLHGTGNYSKPPQTDNQPPKTNGTPPKPETTQAKNGNLGCKKKSSSVSSEGFSESDSVDSEKNSKNGDVADGNCKRMAICDRLHAASTKASHAKTAKMRYLEEADDEDILWIEDLVKGVVKAEGTTDKENRNKRREVLKKVLGRNPSLNEDETKPPKKLEETASSATSGNFARSTPARSSFSRGSFRRPSAPTNNNQNQNQKPQTPTPPPRNLKASFRSSMRKTTKKKSSSKIECISYDEAVFRADNKKVNFLNYDRNNCLKDLKTLMSGRPEDQEEIKVILVQVICICAYVIGCGTQRLC